MHNGRNGSTLERFFFNHFFELCTSDASGCVCLHQCVIHKYGVQLGELVGRQLGVAVAVQLEELPEEGTVKALLIKVTAPFKARARPSSEAASLAETEA